MNTILTDAQVQKYREDGFLMVENFLSEEELSSWRIAVTEAIEQRDGRKMPNSDAKTGEDDGINKEADYYGKVSNFFKMNSSNQAITGVMPAFPRAS